MIDRFRHFSYKWCVLFVFLGSAAAGCGRVDDDAVRIELDQILEESGNDDIRQFYAERDFGMLWIEDTRLSSHAIDFLQRLNAAHLDGLSASRYDLQAVEGTMRAAFTDESDTRTERTRNLAALEYSFSSLFAAYSNDLVNGQVTPEEVGGSWHLEVEQYDRLAALTLVDQAGVDEALNSLADRREGYSGLRGMLNLYQEIANQGGWESIPDGEELNRGARGERVAQLEKRLMAGGDLDSAAADSVFDERVEDAVRSFQRRHGLEATGTLDNATLSAMNVPVEDRVWQLKVNLERSRWLPDDYGERYLIVNIPDFRLHVYDNDSHIMDMAVIVGEVMHPTPMFSDTMTYVVFSPYWNVPHSIAEREILPQAREDDEYLERNSYEIVDEWGPGAEVYDPEDVDLDRFEDEELVIRQKPGPGNALGGIKFMFPNEFNIYLHDTPEGELFTQDDRGFSHGCIRLGQPAELAEFVLEANEGWDRARIEESMDLDEEKPVILENSVPVYIVYLTAWVHGDQVHFRESFYDHDAELEAVLRESPGEADEALASLRGLIREL